MTHHPYHPVYVSLAKQFFTADIEKIGQMAEHVDWAFSQWLGDPECAHKEMQYQLARLAFVIKLRAMA